MNRTSGERRKRVNESEYRALSIMREILSTAKLAVVILAAIAVVVIALVILSIKLR